MDYDTGEKADLYAAAGVEDYWVVDVQNQCIEVRRDPANGRYRTLQTFERGDVVRPLHFSDIQLPVDMLFVDEEDA
jgi:Uma2 family endonuclease